MSSAGATRISTGKLIRQSERVDDPPRLAERVEPGLARDGVLHLAEDHAARRGEDLVGDVAVGARREHPRRHLVHPRDHAGHPVRAGGQDTEDGVGQQLVVDPAAHPRDRLGLGHVGGEPGVALGEQPVGVGEPVHVAVVALRDHVVEGPERLVPRHRLLHRLEQEERLDREGHRGQDPERPETRRGRSRRRRGSARASRRRPRPCPSPAGARRAARRARRRRHRCRGCRSRRPPPTSARRCRPCCAGRGRVARARR